MPLGTYNIYRGHVYIYITINLKKMRQAMIFLVILNLYYQLIQRFIRKYPDHMSMRKVLIYVAVKIKC